MPREHPAYRDNLAELLAYFGPDHHHLSQKDVARFLGRDPRTVRRNYGIDRSGITLPNLAREMCKKGGNINDKS